MKCHRWLIIGAALVLVFGMAPGFVWAQGIQPVDANGNLIAGPPWVKITSADGTNTDLTAEWMPEPGVPVIINIINEDGTIEAPNITEWTASSYLGECTNYPISGDSGLDFDLSVNVLTPLDHGGSATIEIILDALPYKFVLPQDSDKDGIADIYEMKHCGSVDCLAPEEDADLAPVSESDVGDGIAAIDEYRGFRINGEYIRTDPKIKDLFVGTADTPQCENGAYYYDNGDPIKLATYFPSGTGNLDMNAVFGNLYTLMPGIAVHYINNDEWQDFFAGYTAGYGVIMAGASEEERDANAILDRQINTNALEPCGIVKGVRFIECLDIMLSLDPMGIADKNPPDLWDKDNGNAVVYTQRVYHSLQDKFDQGPNRQLKCHTFENGKWKPKWTSASYNPVTEEDKNVIIEKALRWYVAHEIIHCTDLTRTDESTRREPAGYHHVSGTGTNIDVRIVHVVDKKYYDNGFNNFYIPLSYGDSDKRDMRLLGIQ